jgi:hypothetical protein
MKRSKNYLAAAEKVKKDHLYTPLEAVTLVRETSTTKYDATVDVALCLGVDPKKADQAIRSTVNLPHGTGKTARVLVFANGERADEARAAGADIVGGDELIDEVAKGRLDFDAVVATPALLQRWPVSGLRRLRFQAAGWAVPALRGRLGWCLTIPEALLFQELPALVFLGLEPNLMPVRGHFGPF